MAKFFHNSEIISWGTLTQKVKKYISLKLVYEDISKFLYSMIVNNSICPSYIYLFII